MPLGLSRRDWESNRVRLSIICCVCSFPLASILLPGTLAAQEKSGEPMTNLTAIRQLGDTIGVRIAGREIVTRPGIVLVTVRPEAVAWFLEDNISGSLASHGWTPTRQPDAEYRVDVGVDLILVEYGNVRRNGFFGEKLVDRSVGIVTHVRIVHQPTGDIVLTDEVSAQLGDTIPEDMIDRLETPGIPATQGRKPDEGFFTTAFEPIVVLGTIAVAVLLLFTVRS